MTAFACSAPSASFLYLDAGEMASFLIEEERRFGPVPAAEGESLAVRAARAMDREAGREAALRRARLAVFGRR